MMSRDMNLFDKIPADKRTPNVLIYIAKHDVNGYDKIKSESLSSTILMECVRMNLSVFSQIPLEARTKEMSDFVFERDVSTYEKIPKQYITLIMTLRYISEVQSIDASYIPSVFMNCVDVFNKVLPLMGSRLKEIDFRLLTKDVCSMAVKSDGLALEYVPLTILDQDLCADAVIQNMNAYKFVPTKFRTLELKESMIDKNLFAIYNLDIDEITHTMLLSLLRDKSNIGINYVKSTSTNVNIDELLRTYINVYYELRPTIYMHIPSYISDELALKIVKQNPEFSTYTYFMNRSRSFDIACVKAGINFKHLKEQDITYEELIDLVSARASIITELPKRFLSDDLYIVCMKVHEMELVDIPNEYCTEKLVKIAMEYPENCEISLDDNNDSQDDRDQLEASDIIS